MASFLAASARSSPTGRHSGDLAEGYDRWWRSGKAGVVSSGTLICSAQIPAWCEKRGGGEIRGGGEDKGSTLRSPTLCCDVRGA